MRRKRGQQPAHERDEVGGIAGLRIFFSHPRQDAHGQFGQVLERQVIEFAELSQQHRRVEVIAPEAGSVADAKRITVHTW